MTGDFNGDGKLDVAVGDFNSNAIDVLLGNGDGHPDPMRPLKEWLSAHPMPEFHEAGEQTRP